MSQDPILDIWEFRAERDTRSDVVPDGCRDVLVVQPRQGPPELRYTRLQSKTERVSVAKGTRIVGFRLAAGTELELSACFAAISSRASTSDIAEVVDGHCRIRADVREALDAIATHAGRPVQEIAADLGVHVRTMQRVLRRHTGQSPRFWLQLARARRCARALVREPDHADVAFQYGYADQSHMCRDIKRWFAVTPRELLRRPDLTAQLEFPAY